MIPIIGIKIKIIFLGVVFFIKNVLMAVLTIFKMKTNIKKKLRRLKFLVPNLLSRKGKKGYEKSISLKAKKTKILSKINVFLKFVLEYSFFALELSLSSGLSNKRGVFFLFSVINGRINNNGNKNI
jgi:hypothetical protein